MPTTTRDEVKTASSSTITAPTMTNFATQTPTMATAEPAKASTTVASTGFAQFGLSPRLLKDIERLGFVQPTPIQSQAIPALLSGRDVVSLAETGSGKTAAFAIPLIERRIQDPLTRALILAPTRELAVQIGDVFKQLTLSNSNVRCAVLIGGQPLFRQKTALQQNPAIVVATPGRLIDHLNNHSLNLGQFKFLVLDEADRMFDMGFAPQVRQIVGRLPRARQTLLFSATFAQDVRQLASQILVRPIEINAAQKQAPPKQIEQHVLEIQPNLKNDKLLDLINAARGPVLVFARTKHRTNRVHKYLEDYGVKATRIHGDRSQGQRQKSIQDFKSGRVRVLVATDIAARGIDIANISDVINYDIPMTAEDYVHRIGRTGRAGQSGTAMTLVTPEDQANWRAISRKVGFRNEKPRT